MSATARADISDIITLRRTTDQAANTYKSATPGRAPHPAAEGQRGNFWQGAMIRPSQRESPIGP